MLFNSVSVDFNFEVVIEPDEPNESIAAKDGHHGDVAGAFEALLKFLIDPRGIGCFSAFAWMAVKVSEQSVPELLELDEQPMGRFRFSGNAHKTALLVSKFGPLIEHQRALNLASG